MRRNWLVLVLTIIAVLGVDQATKRLVVDSLELYESVVPVPALYPYFQITHVANTGAAFGLLQGAGSLFMIIAPLVVLALIYFYPRATTWASRIAIGLICGGALGNVLDRIEYGHVVDFIHYQIPNLISNVSNLADHAVVLGVIVIFIDIWRTEPAAAPITETAAPPQDENIPG